VCLGSLLGGKNKREREDFCIMIIPVSIHRSSLLFVLYTYSVHKRQRRKRKKNRTKQSSNVLSSNKEPVYLIKSIIAIWKLMAWRSLILTLSEQQRNKWRMRGTRLSYYLTCLCHAHIHIEKILLLVYCVFHSSIIALKCCSTISKISFYSEIEIVEWFYIWPKIGIIKKSINIQ